MSEPMSSDKLWHFGDYFEYVLSMIKYWQVMDMKVYLDLIKEGNVTIKNKMRTSWAKRGRRSAADWKIH
jgi:hypothetical protein